MDLNTDILMNDVALAEQLLEDGERNRGHLSPSNVVFSLRNLLKMKYYPVAVKFFFDEEELDAFQKETEYNVAFHPYTFCHFVAASRQRGDILLGTSDKMGCSNAKYVMGWKEMDEAEISSHRKYTQTRDQAERFVKTKKRLPAGLLEIGRAHV